MSLLLERVLGSFESWESYAQFRAEVVQRRRYVRTPQGEAFLRIVAATCKGRLRKVKKGSIFWRAQLGSSSRPVEGMDDIEEDVAFGPTRMKPRRERASEGRANAKGVPCLYVATTRETAMSEVRPWVGALVSVAQFETVRELTVVDCSVLHDQYVKLAFLNRTFDALSSTMSAPTPEEVDDIVWAAIDGAFSQPVTSADDYAEYAPTQVLAELFRSEGYDGLAYKSAFGEKGYNIALFDIDSAIQVNGLLHSVDRVTYHFSENPRDQYFMKDGNVTRMVITSIEPIPIAKPAEDK